MGKRQHRVATKLSQSDHCSDSVALRAKNLKIAKGNFFLPRSSGRARSGKAQCAESAARYPERSKRRRGNLGAQGARRRRGSSPDAVARLSPPFFPLLPLDLPGDARQLQLLRRVPV